MLSPCFQFFSAAGLAGNLTTEQKILVLKFVSSETEYVISLSAKSVLVGEKRVAMYSIST
jgi:hypothetical protein